MKKYFIKNKRRVSILLAVVLIFSIVASVNFVAASGDKMHINAVLLYSGKSDSRQYLDTYSQLEQSFIANFDIDKVDISKSNVNLNKYDMVYLDASVTGVPKLKDRLVSYVKAGNYIFVPNDFVSYFDHGFFGAKEIVKINSVPKGLVYNEVGDDLAGIQEIIKDFELVYEEYEDYEELSKLDYGYGFIPDTAVSIADFNGVSLYGVNRYGKGAVFYTNPLLPNSFHINGFSLEKTNDLQTHFSNSTATANQLILSEFASLASKLEYGYSIKKILGTYGNPAMAWQLHYEEITGIENSSAITFGELCKEYNTIPSFTLIRNTYKWFSKYETITYLTSDKGSYHMDLNENAYSSGAHVVESDDYLALTEVENTGSYFADNYNFMQMAYPYVDDINQDGFADIICGGSDGKFYYFEGESYKDGWKVKDRRILTDENGNEISVGAYSSPALFDYNSDGVLDIISGNENGDVFLFYGIDNTHFSKGGILISDSDIKRAMPYAGDINGDGIFDLAVGSLNGRINIYEGTVGGEYKQVKTLICQDETFVAPFIYDFNNDGITDLIHGTFDGYVRKLKNKGDYDFVSDGYYDTEEMNYKGNNHIKFGNNSVPRMFDINNDRQDDLISGELEYGLAIPIDSPYFKYRKELSEQVDYIKDNRFYLGIHFYTSQYSSAKREAEELRLHKRAFDTYAIDYDNVGVNMHTWRTSDFSHSQTLLSAKDAGFKWISCFRPVNSTATPDSSAEYSLVCPFFMDFENRDFMVTNASVLGYTYDRFAYMSAKYDLPISEYYHCDFAYRNEEGSRAMIEKVVEYQKANSYNFVREDQLMKSAAAAYNMDLDADSKKTDILNISSSGKKKNYKLYDEDYQDCTGIKIDFGESIDVSKVGIDADVWRYDSSRNDLYIGLNSEVSLNLNCKKQTYKYKLINSGKSHILSVNIPAEVNVTANRANVRFEDDGMMQVRVLGEIKNCTPGWEVKFEDGITTITKFGTESDLEFEIK